MDLTKCFDTKTAADRLGMKPDKLRAWLAKRPDLAPQKFSGSFVWTDFALAQVRQWLSHETAGTCPHCGESLTGPKGATDGE